MATIYKTLLAKGYLPKELPPHFSSELFAAYAITKDGRLRLRSYKPRDNFTRCVRYDLALSGQHPRQLSLPHPASFAKLAELTAKYFRRLLGKSARSSFSRSRPVYVQDAARALRPAVRPSNLGRERALIRAGASYLLQADVSNFYPSLYTHAVGWAIDPSLRNRKNWHDANLLGRKIDRAIMELQGRLSQGVPVGSDISFLLAETVLAQIDHSLRLPRDCAYRWFDDYEIACSSREEAEEYLAHLRKALSTFNLHLNPGKTRIVALPRPAETLWQPTLLERAKSSLDRAGDMVGFFDAAFDLRAKWQYEPILLYALGSLFRISRPTHDAAPVALSSVTQCLLAEPGCAQKALALLTFWQLNGLAIDEGLISRTIDKMVLNHEHGGLSSDVSWALCFCLQNGIALSSESGRVLSRFENDCIMIQALDMQSRGLLPKGFSSKRLSRRLKNAALDDDHWLFVYEVCRHGFMTDSAKEVSDNPLFSDFLAKGMTFYRRTLPSYATVIHPGGAPEWVIQKWISKSLKKEPLGELSEVARSLAQDLSSLEETPRNPDEAILSLLRRYQRADFAALAAHDELYGI